MNMNVLTYLPYTKRYYLTHPWRFFRQCQYNLYHAWERDPEIMSAYWKEVEAKRDARCVSLSKGTKMLEEYFWNLWV